MSKSPLSAPDTDGQAHQSLRILLHDGNQIDLVHGTITRINDSDGQKRTIDTRLWDLGNPLQNSLHSILLLHLRNLSLASCEQLSTAINSFLKQFSADQPRQLEEHHLNQLMKMPTTYMAIFIGALRKIKANGYPGLSKRVMEFLNEGHKWEEKGNGLYYALVTNDPERGALTEQELHSIHSTLNKAYTNHHITLHTYALSWFFIATGLRPIQAVRMKKKDVQIDPGPEGKEVTLRVPLAKGKGKSKTEYWFRRAPSVLAEVLIEYLESPFYKDKGPDSPLFEGTSSDLTNAIISNFRYLNTWSTRLESHIHVSPYRFRYTLATRAILHGASDIEVARLLTHRSTTCIRFYRASLPDLQFPIKSALGYELGLLAGTFMGRTITNLSEATRANDGNALIQDFARMAGENLGACGTEADCYQEAPIACLTCFLFEPFIDAPWEKLYDKIKGDQDRESELRMKQITDKALASIIEIMQIRDALKKGKGG
jgi:integrase